MIYERFYAIDNVCAWPNMTLLPNGELVMMIFNQPCHGKWEGDVECWGSADGGRSWQHRGMVTEHEPGTVRMNVGGGLLPGGDLVYLVSGWNNMKPPGQPIEGMHRDVADIIEPWGCRSSDGGHTWSHSVGGVTMPEKYGNNVIPFGKIVQGADGRLGLAMHGMIGDSRSGRSGAAYVVRSEDDAASWGDPVLIGEDHNETDLLVLRDGRWLAASRAWRGGHLDLYMSEDDGRSWKHQERITAAGQHPAHLLQLDDGSVLLTYGIRHRGLYGIGARISEDAEYWSSPMVVVNFNNPSCGDGGYPYSVQLEDGTVVTAYYAQKTAEHHNYHVAVVRWEPRAWYQVNTSAYAGF